LDASLQCAEGLVAEAAAGGAKLVAFPGTLLPGYPVWLDEAPGVAIWNHPGVKVLYHLLAEQSPGAA
jgi:nitrilase